MSKAIFQRVLKTQQAELTEHLIYARLAAAAGDPNNRKVLSQISNDELRHHGLLEQFSRTQVSPDKFKLWTYYVLARIFGLTFALKLMEWGEQEAQATYRAVSASVPAAAGIEEEEEEHERELVCMVDEERLRYTGDIVRGLNAALVELTGALAGFTLALRQVDLIIVASGITAFAMSLSIAGTEYLATSTEPGSRTPVRAVAYAGVSNLIAAIFLIFPYFVLDNLFLALAWMLLNAIVLVLLFSFYIAVSKEIAFTRHFPRMATASLGVAFLSFLLGYAARHFLHVEV
ncbi:MAG: VIT1/CCC1 transporter family protein [Chloroflexota bacterium]